VEIPSLSDTNSGVEGFEADLKELEAIIESLERGDLSLDAGLKQFERGVALARSCHETLAAAEQKVQALFEADGKHELMDFDRGRANG
jgi:exodeoxyribonuclease VII small subunit